MVQASPNDENVVYVGGLDIYKTTDGGDNWNKISDWVLMYYGGGDEFVHGDIHKLVFNPSNNDEFFVATDGGMFYTNNANSVDIVFTPFSKSYNTFQFYSCGVSFQTGDNRYTGGLQDNGTFLFDGHPYQMDDMIQGGDGAFTMWDKNEDVIISSTYDNSILVYYDGGVTQVNDYTCGTFISPYDYDSENNIIYSNAITFNDDYSDQIFKISDLPATHTDEFVDVNTGTQTPFSASQNEPDIRFLTNDVNINGADTTYSIDNSSYSYPRRFYRTMAEMNTFARLDFEYPFRLMGAKSKLKFGGAYSNKYREYYQNTISFGETSANQYSDIQNYFADDNISATNGVYAQNSQVDDNSNSYKGNQTISAGYLMADIPFLEKFRVVFGARLENIYMETNSIQQINENKTGVGVIDTINILPSFNLTYSPKEMTNIRFAYNKTVARPSFREKSTVQMETKVGDIVIGNPLLQQTEIDNIDLRFEQYFKPGEMFAFGMFYKNFTNPIERTFNTKAQNPEITWRNVDEAKMYGLEAEFGKRLDFINATKNLFIRTNITYIYSQVSIDEQELESKRYFDPNYSDKREMFEQSPWIVNATLSYKNDSIGLSANISYTYNGAKLTIVNPNGIPDVYQKATNDLTFNINKKFGKGFIATFEIKNILDNRSTNFYEYYNVEYIYNDYGWGREFNLKIAYKF